jgi:WD40 repeat protein
MANEADLPVVAPRLLAVGDFEDVSAARSGTESLVVAASAGGDGLAYGRLWDMATGTAIGPPILGQVDGAGGTFSLIPATNGDRPTLVVQRERRMSVFDARTGTQVAECATTHPSSLAVCLAEWWGRTVVVSVRWGDADPLCQVWDAESGRLIREFGVWFPHYGAVADPLLLAGPEIGDGVVLFTTQEERVEDSGWPPYTYDHAYMVLIDLVTGEETARFEGGPPVALHTTEAGPVAVFRSPDKLGMTAVRVPGGEHITTFTGHHARWVDLDTLAVGSVRGRDIVVGGQWHGKSATVWDLTRPKPIASITAPAMQGAAIAQNGAIVLATARGLFAVDADRDWLLDR